LALSRVWLCSKRGEQYDRGTHEEKRSGISRQHVRFFVCSVSFLFNFRFRRCCSRFVSLSTSRVTQLDAPPSDLSEATGFGAVRAFPVYPLSAQDEAGLQHCFWPGRAQVIQRYGT
jgi:hypothetical protein